MYKVGVYFGKMLPPHRGHLSAIINASTKCEKLYVVLSDHKALTTYTCAENGIPNMCANTRMQWLCQELQDIEHIKVVLLDESDIPMYPNGWLPWCSKMFDLIPEKIDVFFVGEKEYAEELPVYFPSSDVEVFDPARTRYPISATEVRRNPLRYWDYILGTARPFFAKKVLITGTESSGKSTLVKYLAKTYMTSWSEEVGRYYASKYLGGNESIFTPDDFLRIAHLQYEQDYEALRHANKVCFFDTDAVVTQYYCNLYMGGYHDAINTYVDPDKYDLILMLKPDVRWVDDGMRLHGEQTERLNLYRELRHLYLVKYGFPENKIIEISGNYNERLERSLEVIDALLDDKTEI